MYDITIRTHIEDGPLIRVQRFIVSAQHRFEALTYLALLLNVDVSSLSNHASVVPLTE